MTVNGGHSTGLFFIYGWKGARGVDGPYYVAGANTVDQAIAAAQAALTTWRRTTAKDVRSGAVVWDSATSTDSPRLRHLTRPEHS